MALKTVKVKSGIFIETRAVYDGSDIEAEAKHFKETKLFDSIYDILDREEAFAKEKISVFLESQKKAEGEKKKIDEEIKSFDRSAYDGLKKLKVLENKQERSGRNIQMIKGILAELKDLLSEAKWARKCLGKGDADMAARAAFWVGYRRGAVVAQSLGTMMWSAERTSKQRKEAGIILSSGKKAEKKLLWVQQDEKRDEIMATRTKLSKRECARRVAKQVGGTQEAILKRWQREEKCKD